MQAQTNRNVKQQMKTDSASVPKQHEIKNKLKAMQTESNCNQNQSKAKAKSKQLRSIKRKQKHWRETNGQQNKSNESNTEKLEAKQQ